MTNESRNGHALAILERQRLLELRRQDSTEIPLRFWNQQVHFTTPATGDPAKALRGFTAARQMLDRYEIGITELADLVAGDVEIFKELLAGNQPVPLVMIDAEDAVASGAEATRAARAGAIHALSHEDWGGTLAFFRPSGLLLDSCVDDLYDVLLAVGRDSPPDRYPLDGIVWPKVEQPEEIHWVSTQLANIENSLGLPPNRIKLQFLVESGHGLSRLADIAEACVARLTGIVFGVADFSADINLPEIRNDHALCDWARYEIVTVAGALAVPAIDAMTLHYPTPIHRGSGLSNRQKSENKAKILGALREVYEDALHGFRLGMAGKWVGHPGQLLMVAAAYRSRVSGDQVQQDVREIEAYSRSQAAGAGATILGDGRTAYMADRATDRHVRARLRRATAAGLLAPEKALELGVITALEKDQLPDVS